MFPKKENLKSKSNGRMLLANVELTGDVYLSDRKGYRDGSGEYIVNAIVQEDTPVYAVLVGAYEQLLKDNNIIGDDFDNSAVIDAGAHIELKAKSKTRPTILGRNKAKIDSFSEIDASFLEGSIVNLICSMWYSDQYKTLGCTLNGIQIVSAKSEFITNDDF